jgi:hypothetical protein
MALVNYSDSESSEPENLPAIKGPSVLTKPTFQKVVDRSNPGKIRVTLPQSSASQEHTSDNSPPAKKPKTSSGGAFSGFNSLLPAPKRVGQFGGIPVSRSTGGKSGLGSSVHLKPGTAPAFSREPEQEQQNYGLMDTEYANNEASSVGIPLPMVLDKTLPTPTEEVKVPGGPLMFKPLSVANKASKKRQHSNNIAVSKPSLPTVPTSTKSSADSHSTRLPRVSLFSMSAESDDLPITDSEAKYNPFRFELSDREDGRLEILTNSDMGTSYEDDTQIKRTVPPLAVPVPPSMQSLDDIAGDLRLSAAERRQLLGRRKGGKIQTATKIINFNTDQEYLHNEELRAAGEQVAHNPVRAIAPGKHSLKQLVNAAQSQKEALEESFAKGKSNRAEASSRYGW